MNDSNQTDAPCLDLTEALDRAMGDAPFLEMLLGEYLQKLPDMVASLKSAVQSNETEKLKNIAHTLKGMSANLGCSSIQQIAMDLEGAASKLDLNTCGGLLTKLDQAVQKTKTHIAQIDWSAFS